MVAKTNDDTIDHRERLKHTRSTFGMFILRKTLCHYHHTKSYPRYDFVPDFVHRGCHVRGGTKSYFRTSYLKLRKISAEVAVGCNFAMESTKSYPTMGTDTRGTTVIAKNLMRH